MYQICAGRSLPGSASCGITLKHHFLEQSMKVFLGLEERGTRAHQVMDRPSSLCALFNRHTMPKASTQKTAWGKTLS